MINVPQKKNFFFFLGYTLYIGKIFYGIVTF